MGYAIRGRIKGENLTAEELQVSAALSGRYCFDPDRTEATDFIPTRVLFGMYLRHMSAGGTPAVLNPTQFGVALRRVFGIDASPKCRRWYHGRKEMGYCHVRGAFSIRSHDGPGNPNLRRERAPISEAERGECVMAA